MKITIPFLTLFALVFTVAARAEEDNRMLTGDKTLVAWTAPANLTQKACGPLSMDNLSGSFDGIILGEIAPAKWMAGSDWFKRTLRDQKDVPAETADPATTVKIAIVYEGKQITIYRNAEIYSQYEIDGATLEFAVGGVIVIGRQLFDPNSKHFAGRIDDVRVYDVALNAGQIADLKPNRKSKIDPWA